MSLINGSKRLIEDEQIPNTSYKKFKSHQIPDDIKSQTFANIDYIGDDLVHSSKNIYESYKLANLPDKKIDMPMINVLTSVSNDFENFVDEKDSYFKLKHNHGRFHQPASEIHAALLTKTSNQNDTNVEKNLPKIFSEKTLSNTLSYENFLSSSFEDLLDEINQYSQLPFNSVSSSSKINQELINERFINNKNVLSISDVPNKIANHNYEPSNYLPLIYFNSKNNKINYPDYNLFKNETNPFNINNINEKVFNDVCLNDTKEHINTNNMVTNNFDLHCVKRSENNNQVGINELQNGNANMLSSENLIINYFNQSVELSENNLSHDNKKIEDNYIVSTNQVTLESQNSNEKDFTADRKFHLFSFEDLENYIFESNENETNNSTKMEINAMNCVENSLNTTNRYNNSVFESNNNNNSKVSNNELNDQSESQTKENIINCKKINEEPHIKNNELTSNLIFKYNLNINDSYLPMRSETNNNNRNVESFPQQANSNTINQNHENLISNEAFIPEIDKILTLESIKIIPTKEADENKKKKRLPENKVSSYNIYQFNENACELQNEGIQKNVDEDKKNILNSWVPRKKQLSAENKSKYCENNINTKNNLLHSETQLRINNFGGVKIPDTNNPPNEHNYQYLKSSDYIGDCLDASFNNNLYFKDNVPSNYYNNKISETIQNEFDLVSKNKKEIKNNKIIIISNEVIKEGNTSKSNSEMNTNTTDKNKCFIEREQNFLHENSNINENIRKNHLFEPGNQYHAGCHIDLNDNMDAHLNKEILPCEIYDLISNLHTNSDLSHEESFTDGKDIITDKNTVYNNKIDTMDFTQSENRLELFPDVKLAFENSKEYAKITNDSMNINYNTFCHEWHLNDINTKMQKNLQNEEFTLNDINMDLNNDCTDFKTHKINNLNLDEFFSIQVKEQNFSVYLNKNALSDKRIKGIIEKFYGMHNFNERVKIIFQYIFLKIKQINFTIFLNSKKKEEILLEIYDVFANANLSTFIEQSIATKYSNISENEFNVDTFFIFLKKLILSFFMNSNIADNFLNLIETSCMCIFSQTKNIDELIYSMHDNLTLFNEEKLAYLLIEKHSLKILQKNPSIPNFTAKVHLLAILYTLTVFNSINWREIINTEYSIQKNKATIVNFNQIRKNIEAKFLRLIFQLRTLFYRYIYYLESNIVIEHYICLARTNFIGQYLNLITKKAIKQTNHLNYTQSQAFFMILILLVAKQKQEYFFNKNLPGHYGLEKLYECDRKTVNHFLFSNRFADFLSNNLRYLYFFYYTLLYFENISVEVQKSSKDYSLLINNYNNVKKKIIIWFKIILFEDKNIDCFVPDFFNQIQTAKNLEYFNKFVNMHVKSINDITLLKSKYLELFNEIGEEINLKATFSVKALIHMSINLFRQFLNIIYEFDFDVID